MAAPIINPLPPAPAPGDPGDVFDAKAFEFTLAMNPFATQANELAVWFENRASALEQTVWEGDLASALGQAVTDAQAAQSEAEQSVTDAELARSQAESARDEAEAARDSAQLAKSGAQTAQSQAESTRDEAEAARDSAQLAETGAEAVESGLRAVVGSYPDTSAGLAATSEGEYFALDGSGHIYLNNAGTADQITDYASLASGIGMISAALDAINGEVV